MSKLKLSALVVISALGLYLLFGAVGQSLFNCDNVGIHQAESPDGQYRAAIVVSTCKDSTRNGVYLYFSNLETGSYVRRTLVKDTSITNFELNWQGNDEFEIIIPSGVDWDDIRSGRSFEGVRVEYRNAPHGEFSN